MTRKHFRELADALHSIRPSPDFPLDFAMWSDAVDKTADVCAASNPRFKLALFIAACEHGDGVAQKV